MSITGKVSEETKEYQTDTETQKEFTPAEPELFEGDPWEMEEQGEHFCDCGCGHELTPDYVEDLLIVSGYHRDEQVPHIVIVAALQVCWNYIKVCNFFLDHVKLSAEKINGKVEEEYPFNVAVDIAGYFSRTWQGCPALDCDGDLDFRDEVADPDDVPL